MEGFCQKMLFFCSVFLVGCYITRVQSSGLELIMQKWSHSLVEVDLAWSTATASLDAAVLALAEKGSESPLRFTILLKQNFILHCNFHLQDNKSVWFFS